jgi:PiT family inorganic phosphate transporter
MPHFFETAWDNLGTYPFAQLPLLVWLLVLLALSFDFLNGLHDAANSIATVVSTRVLSPGVAIVWAAFFNFVAFLVFPLKVAGTIQADVIQQSIIDNQFLTATLVGACAWNIITWYLGLPTSSSHALIGGMVGAAFAKTGTFAPLQGGFFLIVLFIFLAPAIGFVLGTAIAVAVSWLFRHTPPRRVDRTFRWGQLFSAGFFSLGHGGNDAQKTMGIIFLLLVTAANANPSLAWQGRFYLDDSSFAKLAAGPDPVPRPVLDRLQGLRGKEYATRQDLQEALRGVLSTEQRERYDAKVVAAADHPHVPTEVVLACHLAMGLGTLFGGWRIVKTMGQGIIRLRPVDGFCAETGAAVTLAMTTFIKGIPISTTHTITGAIVGVGSLKRLSAVRWTVAGQVVWAWVLTIPGAGVVACLTLLPLRLLAG